MMKPKTDDRAALESALELTLAEKDQGRVEQVREMLAKDRRDALEFCAYHRQIAALHLRPWQEPPCVADEDDPDERDKDAQQLLRRMLSLGVSRYHPDPLRACEEAEARGGVAERNLKV